MMNINTKTAGPQATLSGAQRSYRYRHRISFEETNLMGNVYFARHVAWQGRVRELFLLEHAPGVLRQLDGALRLVTLNVTCEYFAELRALDEVEISMSLAYQRQHRIGLAFEYTLLGAGGETLAARGTQEVGCMEQTGTGLVPCAVPKDLSNALDGFR
jgi:enediyne biosynthesis thioesterase